MTDTRGEFQYQLAGFSGCTIEVRRLGDQTLVRKTAQNPEFNKKLIREVGKLTELAADIFVDGTDDVYYPTFTGYELMATADLCIQTYSYSAVEAVIAALPTVCITTPRDYPLSQRDWRHTMAGELQFNNDSGGLFNYPGCVNSVEWSQAVRYFDQAKLEDFTINTDKRAEYISKFAGLGKESSSSKVLKVIHGS